MVGLITLNWNDVVSSKTVRTPDVSLADYVGHLTTFSDLEVVNEKQVNGKNADRVYAVAKNGNVDAHRIVLPKLDGDALIAHCERNNINITGASFETMVYPAGKAGNGARLVDTHKS